ncbi:prolyl oligopeptidase family serine peptidase [Lacimicrobium sp. SS2-24]|uniref:alpha/beta hydrolase family protein n=1 Tax=Lacimicrobium sp. SS2-24 TaxID=2005569 RepID=UPI000B4B5B79|nr:prolyl oligopeptidase family serine peptidase [Lacimicrobium sp. SS2-24]
MYKLLILLIILAPSLVHSQMLDSKRIRVVGPIPFQQSMDSPHLDAMYQQTQAQVMEAGMAPLEAFGQTYPWSTAAEITGSQAGLMAYTLTLSVQRFTQGELVITGLKKPKVFVAGTVAEKGEKGYKLALINGEHRLVILAQGTEEEKAPGFEFIGKAEWDEVALADGAAHRLSMQQLYDSQVVSSLNVSDDGEYALVGYRHYEQHSGDTPITHTELVALDSASIKHRWSDSMAGATFTPSSEALVYLQGERLLSLDLSSFETRTLAEGVDDVSGFRFLDDNTLIFSWKQDGKDDGKLVKRYQSLQDRWSYWRDNSQLYQLDMQSGLIRQLTQADSSTYLLDISDDKQRLLLMRSVVDYSQPPHGKSALYELNLSSLQERLIGEYWALNGAVYSDKGLYALGGPNFAQGKGLAVGAGQTANDYDGQLYHMQLDGSGVTALSTQFDPAITSMRSVGHNQLVLTVTDESRTRLYGFKNNRYTLLSPKLDVIDQVAVAKGNTPRLVYAGTSASLPQALYTQKWDRDAKKLWDASQDYQHTRIPKMQEFDFVNDRGDKIKGRVYLPHDLDKQQQYPALVYYYGGTSPVSRAFTGRYPFNLWAAQGYVVYVLQPSGAYGFGQQFSARHVNAWGEYTAADIMQGTKAFLDAHPYVDKNKVGHLGASYGGFMTMYLATQTDMYAASVSHAGIANIASYWGEGWWGALYSGVASRGSFPWNNAELYTEQSPLFHADKISNPMLLIHGDADTNVPPGESQQMYTALKLLGKDVELVEYKGDNHHILSREKSFHWWSTILAYFDKHLKQQPQWWQYLYADE